MTCVEKALLCPAHLVLGVSVTVGVARILRILGILGIQLGCRGVPGLSGDILVREQQRRRVAAAVPAQLLAGVHHELLVAGGGPLVLVDVVRVDLVLVVAGVRVEQLAGRRLRVLWIL